MSSPTDRRTHLTSSTQLQSPVTNAHQHRSSHDAAASICAHLIVHNGLSRVRIAHAVGLPSLVIEESIKNGVSSATLRVQLRNWLFESGSSPQQKLRVPESLLQQLQEDCAVDEIEKQQHQRNGIVSSFGVDGSPFSALDPVSQQHFTRLQHSVGQSFISILNDPGEPTVNVDWSTWLGGKLYDAFDFNGRVGNLEDMMRNFTERQVGPESSAALLAEYPPTHDFSAYVKLISDAYQANRREGIANDAGEWREDGRGDFMTGERGGAVAHDDLSGPWPSGVPAEFFDKEYSTAAELELLSEAVGESVPASLPLPAPHVSASGPPAAAKQAAGAGAGAAAAAPSKANAAAASSVSLAAADASAPAQKTQELAATPLLRRIVDNTTFTNDFEYLESRNKELRVWESAVEKCLLQHVKHRSEDFFATSQQFGSLSGDARSVLVDAQVAREGGMRAGEHVVAEYLRIGQLYRRRQNFVQLQLTATTAQRVLRRLGDVENWAALPERDFGETLAICNALVDLEAAGKSSTDTESTIAWDTLIQLKCLAEVPARVRQARKALEAAVLDEYCRVLLSDLSDGDGGERVGVMCASVTRLGVLNTANQLYFVKVVEALQVAAQESLVSLFMNTGALDDAKANELLAVAGGDTVALALPDARQQLFGFAKHLRPHSYLQVLQQFVDALVDFVTRVSQNWGFFVTGGLRRALAMYANQEAMVEQTTKELFARVCGEAEWLVASMLEVFATGQLLPSMEDLEQLVRISVQLPLRVTTDVAGRLVSVLDASTAETAARRRRSHAQTTTGGTKQPADALEGLEPVGFLVYRPSRVIGTTIQRLAKRCFRRQHSSTKEKVVMVTEGETWTAKESVDAVIQLEVEEMCTVDAAALASFHLQSLWVLTGSAGDGNNGGAFGYGSGQQPSGSLARRKPSMPTGAAELLNTDATKLYVRLPRSIGGVSTTPMTASSPSTHHHASNGTAAAAAAHRTTQEEDDMEEGRLVANSLLVLMDLLHKYHRCIALFPFLAFDVVSRMNDLIDAYEGQTAAMVLGARAVEKGTLSTITTQHLCVASQCVSYLAELIPALQAHLTAAIRGSASDAEVRRRAPRDVLAVAYALGLVAAPASSSSGTGTAVPAATAVASAAALTSPEKGKLFIDNDWNRVLKNCRAHRNEFFSKMGSLVYRKVDSLGTTAVQKGQWSAGGNEWVMAMLREVARLMRALRPLLPPADMDGVIVPLLSSLSVMLREATVRIPVLAKDDRAAATSDIMLFKANVEKFGYDVLTCAEVNSVAAVMQGGRSFAPVSSEEAVLAWFLPAPAPPAAAAAQAGPRPPTAAK